MFQVFQGVSGVNLLRVNDILDAQKGDQGGRPKKRPKFNAA